MVLTCPGLAGLADFFLAAYKQQSQRWAVSMFKGLSDEEIQEVTCLCGVQPSAVSSAYQALCNAAAVPAEAAEAG